MKNRRFIVGVICALFAGWTGANADLRYQAFDDWDTQTDAGTYTNTGWVVENASLITNSAIQGVSVYMEGTAASNQAIVSPRLSEGVRQVDVRYKVAALQQNVWINEVDYDNDGDDRDEWVELCGAAGLSLDDYELVTIDQTGSEDNTFDLAGANFTFEDEENGYGFCLIGEITNAYGVSPDFTPSGWTYNEIQNGAADSIQLRLKTGSVNVHLIDYEGDNPNTSDDQNTSIGDNNDDVKTTIYLTGAGNDFDDFGWDNDTDAGTPGSKNKGQTLYMPSIDPAASATMDFALQTSTDRVTWASVSNKPFNTIRRVKFNVCGRNTSDNQWIGHWNNYTQLVASTATNFGWIDDQGETVEGLGLYTVSPADDARAPEKVTNGLYPFAVMGSALVNTPSGDFRTEIRFSGLDTNRTYDLRLFSYAESGSFSHYFVFGGQQQVFSDMAGNRTQTVDFVDISPSAAGELTLMMTNDAGTIYLNAMELMWRESTEKTASFVVEDPDAHYIRLVRESGSDPVYLDHMYAAPCDGFTNVVISTNSIVGEVFSEYSNRYVQVYTQSPNDEDRLFYPHTLLSGNGEIEIDLENTECRYDIADFGLMFREDLTSTCRVVLVAHQEQTQRLQYWVRPATGTNMEEVAFEPGVALPRWLRLRRQHNTVSAHYSSDGQRWTTLYQQTISALRDDLYAGIYIESDKFVSTAAAFMPTLTVRGADHDRPDAPYGLRARSTNEMVSLDWFLPSEAEGMLLLHREGQPVTDVPAFGQTYTNGQALAGGARVIEQGDETYYTHTDLTARTNHYYALYSYKTGYDSQRLYSHEYPFSLFVYGYPADVVFENPGPRPDPVTPLNAARLQSVIVATNGATNLTAVAYWRIGSTGAFTSVAMTQSQTTNFLMNGVIPPQDIGAEIEYYIQCTFNGAPGGLSMSPRYYPPEGSNNPASFIVVREVWINELKINDTWRPWGSQPAFIELAGPAGRNLTNWYIRVMTNAFNTGWNTYTITTNTVIDNDAGSYGFWVLGNSYTASDWDQYMDIELYQTPVAVELYNRSNKLVHALTVDIMSNGYEYIPLSDSDDWPGTTGIALDGYGSAYTNMGWGISSVSPGEANPSQSFTRVWIEALDNDAWESTPVTNTAVFRIYREPAYGAMGVYLDLYGTATNGLDYNVSEYITFGTNASYTDLTIIPTDDGLEESDETVIAEIQESGDGAYYPGEPYAALATIYDNDRNRPPVVDAGSNKTVGATYTLEATVTDDGKPFGTLSYNWSLLDGPGVVSFNDTNALNPVVQIETSGEYLLQLIASDTSLSATDTVALTVVGPPTIVSIEAMLNSTSVVITFDQTVEETTAEYLLHYPDPAGYSVMNAERIADHRVRLDVTDLSPGAFYSQRVENVENEYGSLVDDGMAFQHANLLFDGAFSGSNVFLSATGDWTVGSRSLYAWHASTGAWTRLNAYAEIPTSTNEWYYNLVQVITNIPYNTLTLSFDYHKFSPGAVGLEYYVYGFTNSNFTLPIGGGAVDPDTLLPTNGALEASANTTWEIPHSFAWTSHEKTFALSASNYTHMAVIFLSGNIGTNFAEIDDVVLAEANSAPTANAGDNLTTGVGLTNMLYGAMEDDGLPLGETATYQWTVVTNEGSYTLLDATSLTARVVFEQQGTNCLRLRVDDGEYTDDDYLYVYVVNQAPVPDIEQPTAAASFPAASNIHFTGYASDLEDGAVTATQLVWASDLNGMFGRGTSVWTRILQPGEHVITLTATDSQGRSGSTNIALTIEDSTNLVVLAEYEETAPAVFQWTGYAYGTVVDNLLTNGSFETGDLSGWTIRDLEPDVSGDRSYHGDYGLRALNQILQHGVRQEVDLVEGEDYRFWGYARAGADIESLGGQLKLYAGQAALNSSTYGLSTLSTQTAWTALGGYFTMDDNQLFINMSALNGGTGAWFDAVSLVPSGKCAYVTYGWDFGDGISSTDPDPLHAYISNGTYTVTMTVTDELGHVSSESVEMDITNARPNYVFINARSNAVEYPWSAGQFHFRRFGSTASNLPVAYTISGTASNGGDYAAISNTFAFPAGVSNVYLSIEPVRDGLLEGDETVTLQLIDIGDAYGLTSPDRATVTLYDDDVLTPTNLTADFVTGTTYDIELTWTDRTGEEAGFVIQRRQGYGDIAQITDNEQTNTEAVGDWSLLTDQSAYEEGFHRALAESGSSEYFRFSPNVPEPGLYEVQVYYPSYGGVATSVPVRINGAGSTNTYTVNQSLQAATWVTVATRSLNADSSIDILRNATPQYYNVLADAVRCFKDGNEFETVAVAASNAVSFVDSNLIGSVMYFWRIAATNQYGRTDWSDAVGYETPGNPSVLASPQSLEVDESGSNYFDVVMSKVLLQPYTITVWRASGDADLTVWPTNLYFNPATWDIAQRVYVSAAEDGDIANGTALFSVTRDGLTPNTQTVTVVENDNDGYEQHVRIDFGDKQGRAFGWNCVTDNTEIAQYNLIDSNGIPTPIHFLGADCNGGIRADGLTLSDYPDAVTRDLTRLYNSPTYTFENIDASAVYEAVVYASCNEDLITDPYQRATIGSQVITQATEKAMAADLFEGVRPSGDGTLTVALEKLAGPVQINFIDLSWRTVQVEADTHTIGVLEGGTNIVRVRLNYNPGKTTKVCLSRVSGDADLSTAGSTSVTFNASNWSNWQTFAIAAAPDANAESGEAVFVCNGVGAAGALITATEAELEAFEDPVTVPEGKSRYVKLRPSAAIYAPLTVTVARVSGDTDLSLFGDSTLVFTPANWEIYQNITVMAAEDGDTTDGSATFRVSCDVLPDLDVTVTEDDNDTASIEMANDTLFVPEGGASNIYVRLTLAPVNATTVTVSKASGDGDLTVTGDPAELIFNAGNWNTWQSAVVNAAADADTLDGSAYITVSSPGMRSLEALAVEVDDDSEADESFTILIDCGMDTAQTTGNWNNVYAPWWVDRYWIEDMIDTNGADTGIDVYCPDRFETRLFTGLGDGTLYPTSAVGDAFRMRFNTHSNGVLQFQDLPAEAPEFTMSFLGSWNGGQDALMHVTIGSSSVVYNAHGNSTTQAVIDRIGADVNGQFEVRFRRDGTDSAFLNAMRLDYTIPGLKPVATPDPLYVPENGSNTLYVRLSKAVASATTVNVSRLSGDTDLVFAGPTQLVFNASNWNVHQPVWIAADNDIDALDSEMKLQLDLNGSSATATVIERDDDAVFARRVLIDFGSATYETTGQWNNVTQYLMDTNPVVSDLRDHVGDSSGLSLTITNDFAGFQDSASIPGIYPETAMKDGTWVTASETVIGGLRIDGLVTTRTYSILMYGYVNNSNSTPTVYTVDGESKLLDIAYNASNVVTFMIDGNSSDGRVDITVDGETGGNYRKFLSVMEIRYNEQISAVLETNLLSVPEGGTAELGIRLLREPLNTRTVSVARVSGDEDVSVFVGDLLTFTPAAWDTWKYVTFEAADDPDATNGTAVFSVRLGGEAPVSITINESDDDSGAGGDADADGIPDWWEERHGGGPTSLDPYGDEDSDGYYNVEEWIAYTDPTNAASYLMIDEMRSAEAGDAYIIRWTSATNRVYSVLWGTNLFNVFDELATNIPAIPPQNTYTDSVHNVEDSIYYRIDVRMEGE